jgi:hypothetical protein
MSRKRLFTVYRKEGRREIVSEKNLKNVVLLSDERPSFQGADFYEEGVSLKYYFDYKKNSWIHKRIKYIPLVDFKDYTFDELKEMAETQLELGCVFKSGDILTLREFVYVDANGVVAQGYCVVYKALELNTNAKIIRSYTHYLPQYWALWRLDDALEGFINRIKQGELTRPLSNSLKDLLGST